MFQAGKYLLATVAVALVAAGAYWYALAHQDNAALAQRWSEAGRSLQALAAEGSDLPFATADRTDYFRMAYLKILNFNPGLASADRRILREAQDEAERIGTSGHHIVYGLDPVMLELRSGQFFRRALELDPNNAAANGGLRDAIDYLLAIARGCSNPGTRCDPSRLYQSILAFDPENVEARTRRRDLHVQFARDAEVLIRNGAIRDVAALLQAIQEQEPGHTEAAALQPRIVHLVIEQGRRAIDGGQVGYGALQWLSQARDLDPEGAETKQLGVAVADGIAEAADRRFLKDMPDVNGESLLLYHKALEIDPGNARAEEGIAAVTLYWEISRDMENGATADFKQALETVAAEDPERAGLAKLRQLMGKSAAN